MTRTLPREEIAEYQGILKHKDMNKPTKQTLWLNMKRFLNVVAPGTTFTRQYLLMFTHHQGFTNDDTVDQYRTYMTRAGYLSIDSRGVYKKEKELLFGTSLNQLKQEAYRKTVLAKYPHGVDWDHPINHGMMSYRT